MWGRGQEEGVQAGKIGPTPDSRWQPIATRTRAAPGRGPQPSLRIKAPNRETGLTGVEFDGGKSIY